MDLIQRDRCQSFVTKDTSEIRELMAYRNSACQRMSLAEATLYPGKATERHCHPVAEEIYYFLSGRGRMCLGDEMTEVVAGDAVLIPPGVFHQTWNLGSEKLVFLCICAPAYEHSDTVIDET